MGLLLVLIGLAGTLFGLLNLIRPLGRLRIETRRQASRFLGASLVVFVLGGLLSPPGEGPVEPGAAPEATATTPPEPGSTVGATSTVTGSTSTVTGSTSTVTGSTSPSVVKPTLPPIPDAGVVFAPIGPSPAGDPQASPPPGSEVATVASITDGDTLRLRIGETSEAVRLIGTNSPEPGECFAAESALILSILTPVGSRVFATSDVSDRDQFDRLLRYLWVGGLSVNDEMVRRGAAIARRYPPDTALASRLDAAQDYARREQLGLWDPAACGPAAGTEVEIVSIEADAPGNDNQNLNAEYVVLRNNGEIGVDLTGWTLRDESASNRYTFPAGLIFAVGAELTVYTGCGSDTGGALYWCSSGAVWNNDGDTAFVLDHNGNVVHALSYLPPTAGATGSSLAGDDCDPSYPEVCIPPPPPDLDCGEVPYRRFQVVGSDPHRFDGNRDGIGCES